MQEELAQERDECTVYSDPDCRATRSVDLDTCTRSLGRIWNSGPVHAKSWERVAPVTPS